MPGVPSGSPAWAARRYPDGTPYLQQALDGYWVDFRPALPQQDDALFVTFEAADPPLQRPDAGRYPWGYAFVRKSPGALLGIKPARVDWYRGASLHAFFRSAELQALARPFRRVVLMGSSMGGYAALAFAEVFPGCEVIAHNPQVSLSSAQVPWETRFPEGRAQDWRGDFADARVGARRASRVHLTYDPFDRLDRLHVQQIDPVNVLAMRVPFIGHGVPYWLLKMGVLEAYTRAALSGELDGAGCARLARARRRLPRYHLNLAQRTRNPALRLHALRQAAALDPTDARTVLSVAQALAAAGLWVEAADHADRAAQADPALVSAHTLCVHYATRAGQGERAVTAARQALARRPGHADGLRVLSRALHAHGQLTEAIATAREAVALEPTHATGMASLAQFLSAAGQHAEAVAWAERNLAGTPGDPGLQKALDHDRRRSGAR